MGAVVWAARGGAARARWCSKCPAKPAEAVDLVSKKCQCGQHWPCFGLPGDAAKAARWCSKCPEKPNEAVDVANKNRGQRQRDRQRAQPSGAAVAQAPGT